MSMVSDMVQSITVESRFLPAFTIERPFSESTAPPNPIIQALRPKITIRTSLGTNSSAPYGEPGTSLWPQVRFAGIALAALVAVVLVARVIKR